MTKQEFLAQLEQGLSSLPRQDIEERVSFYSEMIDDRMEEGLSEEQAVADVGSVEEIIAQAMEDRSLLRQITDKVIPKRRLTGLEIALIILGAPLWISLLVGILVISLSGYVVIWSTAVTLWAVFGALAGTGLGCILCGILYAVQGHTVSAVALAGTGLICTGIAILLFYSSKLTTTGLVYVTKMITKGIKSLFHRKGDAQ